MSAQSQQSTGHASLRLICACLFAMWRGANRRASASDATGDCEPSATGESVDVGESSTAGLVSLVRSVTKDCAGVLRAPSSPKIFNVLIRAPLQRGPSLSLGRPG